MGGCEGVGVGEGGTSRSKQVPAQGDMGYDSGSTEDTFSHPPWSLVNSALKSGIASNQSFSAPRIPAMFLSSRSLTIQHRSGMFLVELSNWRNFPLYKTSSGENDINQCFDRQYSVSQCEGAVKPCTAFKCQTCTAPVFMNSLLYLSHEMHCSAIAPRTSPKYPV